MTDYTNILALVSVLSAFGYIVVQRLELIRQDKKIEELRDQYAAEHRTLCTMREILEENHMVSVAPLLSKARSAKDNYGSN